MSRPRLVRALLYLFDDLVHESSVSSRLSSSSRCCCVGWTWCGSDRALLFNTVLGSRPIRPDYFLCISPRQRIRQERQLLVRLSRSGQLQWSTVVCGSHDGIGDTP